MAKKIPMRQCVGCGEMKSKKDMMRVLRSEDGSILLDMTGRKNGRGAYLCMNRECLVKAGKNKGLERSLKVNIPQEIYENLEKEFEEGEHAEQTE
ncbi:MAG: YlxR family protein [Lachnospiraceae bacterium]|nr:YlxR family protein [Lachnospiraceae bacterium]